MGRIMLCCIPAMVAIGIGGANGQGLAQTECIAVDYSSLPMTDATNDYARAAVLLAYPAVSFSLDDRSLRVADNPWIEFGEVRDVPAGERLEDTRVSEQFTEIYPLSFDLEARETPYFDPGRARNSAFFSALYGQDEHSVRASLVRVTAPQFSASFHVTRRQNVACQLEAVLDSLQAAQRDYSEIFSDVGGGFNWRTISGTDRLSPHSFGIAVDVNAQLGQYWKWTGASEGNVGAYTNKIPQEVVETFERYGFIWGGKWHHFDGMHFEYRPEIILHARFIADDLK